MHSRHIKIIIPFFKSTNKNLCIKNLIVFFCIFAKQIRNTNELDRTTSYFMNVKLALYKIP